MTIIVYSKENCYQCVITKRALDKEGIAYEEAKAEDYMDYLKTFEIKEMPIVVTDTEAWGGFRPDLIKKYK